jgi:endonuclease III
MNEKNIGRIIKLLEDYTSQYKLPVAELTKKWQGDPFKILVTVMISSRTKDEIAAQAAERLFSKAKTLKATKNLSLEEIESLIYPVNFYKTKARHIKEIAAIIDMDFRGNIPDTIEGLTTLPGVGIKTSNLVLNTAFGKDCIGVDTHVHQILNRLGYVKTKTPNETETELRKKLPKKYWRKINVILVLFGQNICTSVSPFCSSCPIQGYCPRIGVKKRR